MNSLQGKKVKKFNDILYFTEQYTVQCNCILYVLSVETFFSEKEICEIEVINPLIPHQLETINQVFFMLLAVYFTPSKVIFYRLLSRDQFCLATSTCECGPH